MLGGRRETLRDSFSGGSDHRQHRPGLHRLTFGHDDAQQHSAGGRGDLGVDLVGVDSEQRLVLVDRLSLGLSHFETVPSTTDLPN
jgi:hypothetical protein